MKKNIYLFAFAILALGHSVPVAAQIINTVAGNGTAGFGPDGIAATSSKVNTPHGVAVDAAGNLYIADSDNDRIRKVTPTGTISTIGGTGVAGYTGDGVATARQIHGPTGIAVDASGNIFFTDRGNNLVRKISTTGIMTTIAGTYGGVFGSPSPDGGPATAVVLGLPYGIAVDGAGNVIFADQQNHRIRMISPAGIISGVAGASVGFAGFAGDGGLATASTARLNAPAGVAVDGAGNIYIADYANNKVRKVDAAGMLSTIAGAGLPGYGYSGDGGPATAAHFYYPEGVAVDGPGNVYVCDRNNNVVRKIGLTGVINTIAGTGSPAFSGDGGPAILATLNQTTGVAVQDNGDVYIADNSNNRIRRIKIGSAPFFTNGHSQSVSSCPTELIPLDTILRVDDINVGQTETWHVVLPPAHGVLVAAYTATSTGSTITPVGLNYAPAVGYTGTDSFKVEVSDGTSSPHDTTTVYITILPFPSAGTITGIDSVCPGYTRLLADTATGGVWSSSNTVTATISATGNVSGIVPGTTTISYTVTSACGTVYAAIVFTVIATTPCITAVLPVAETMQNGIIIKPNPAHGIFTVSLPGEAQEKAKVTITDITGRTVAEFELSGNISREIRLSQPAGTYFISAINAHARYVSTFTITN